MKRHVIGYNCLMDQYMVLKRALDGAKKYIEQLGQQLKNRDAIIITKLINHIETRIS